MEEQFNKETNEVSFVVRREKELKEWNEQKLPKVLPGHSGGKLPGRSTKEKGRGGGVDQDGGERRIRGQIVQEVVAGIKEKVGVHDGCKEAYKNQLGKAHRSKMKKRRKGAKCQHSGRKSKNWRRSRNEEGWKEATCSWMSCKNYGSLRCMSACRMAQE